ncbi:MAG TPA: hypothetical protein VND65_18105 [Candidatus Binatia bacterium]|nr:hypothetical protein [Candidatus Binatia bacterium]
MSLNPTKAYSVTFISDGLSTNLAIDCSLAPISQDFTGAQPSAVLAPAVTSTFTGPLSGVSATLSGTTVTFTFGSAPPRVDGSSNVIEYTATFVLEFP